MTVGSGTGRNIFSISKSSKDRIEGINKQGSQDLPKDFFPIFHAAVKIERKSFPWSWVEGHVGNVELRLYPRVLCVLWGENIGLGPKKDRKGNERKS